MNAEEPVELGEPIESIEEAGTVYRAYRTKARLRANHFDGGYGEQILGIAFRHRTLPRHALIYAKDSTGMGVQTARTAKDRLRQLQRLVAPSTGWALKRVLFFEDVEVEHSVGNPRYLVREKKTVDFSRYNIAVGIKRTEVSLRRSISKALAPTIVVISLIALLLLGAGDRRLGRRMVKTRWALQACATLALLISVEVILGEWLTTRTVTYYSAFLTRTFDVLWWVVPAFLINVAVNRLLWEPIEAKSGRSVPTILTLFCSFLIFLLALFGVVAFVFDQKLTSLLATSGVAAMIVGLAIQINITNIFSGIALNLERPFRIGDWIMVHGRTGLPDDGIIGCVVDINWRTTRLKTTSNTVVVIPNGSISEKTITNFMAPTEVSRFELNFVVDQTVPVAEVTEAIAQGVQSIEGTENLGPLASPKWKVRVNSVTPDGIEYQLRYFIVPRNVSPSKARNTITTAVISALQDRSIQLAHPKLDLTPRAQEHPHVEDPHQ